MGVLVGRVETCSILLVAAWFGSFTSAIFLLSAKDTYVAQATALVVRDASDPGNLRATGVPLGVMYVGV